MVDFGIVGEPGNTLTIASQLASKACQTIAILHQQNPNFIAEKFRQRDWQAEAFRSGFVQKVTTLLAETPVSQQMQKCYQAVLKQVFDATFLGTDAYQRLFIELSHITESYRCEVRVSVVLESGTGVPII